MAENQQEARLVIVGKKPVFRYVTASITLLNRGFREVEFVARGKTYHYVLTRSSFSGNLSAKM
jgi:DNA-binding protein Alba